MTAFSEKEGKQVWQTKVDGEARGLVVVNNRLLVSTTTGAIYCFEHQQTATASTTTKESTKFSNPYPTDELTEKYASAAKEILKRTPRKKGFCLVLDAGIGRLAYEIAKQSELKVYAVSTDAKQVATARKLLSQAGLYGHRITVHHQQHAKLPYSNYFANVIVSDEFVTTGTSQHRFELHRTTS